MVAELDAGDQFGEIALLHHVPRTGDVVTLGATTTLSLLREDFDLALRDAVIRG